MKRIILCWLLIILSSCNKEASKSPPVTSPSNIASQEKAKTFVKEASNSIHESLQIESSDLQKWEKEGLISSEEAADLAKFI